MMHNTYPFTTENGQGTKRGVIGRARRGARRFWAWVRGPEFLSGSGEVAVSFSPDSVLPAGSAKTAARSTLAVDANGRIASSENPRLSTIRAVNSAAVASQTHKAWNSTSTFGAFVRECVVAVLTRIDGIRLVSSKNADPGDDPDEPAEVHSSRLIAGREAMLGLNPTELFEYDAKATASFEFRDNQHFYESTAPSGVAINYLTKIPASLNYSCYSMYVQVVKPKAGITAANYGFWVRCINSAIDGDWEDGVRKMIPFNIDGTGDNLGYFINDQKIIGARQAALADMSTTGTDTDGAARTKINEILAALRAHGLIAT